MAWSNQQVFFMLLAMLIVSMFNNHVTTAKRPNRRGARLRKYIGQPFVDTPSRKLPPIIAEILDSDEPPVVNVNQRRSFDIARELVAERARYMLKLYRKYRDGLFSDANTVRSIHADIDHMNNEPILSFNLSGLTFRDQVFSASLHIHQKRSRRRRRQADTRIRVSVYQTTPLFSHQVAEFSLMGHHTGWRALNVTLPVTSALIHGGPDGPQLISVKLARERLNGQQLTIMPNRFTKQQTKPFLVVFSNETDQNLEADHLKQRLHKGDINLIGKPGPLPALTKGEEPTTTTVKPPNSQTTVKPGSDRVVYVPVHPPKNPPPQPSQETTTMATENKTYPPRQDNELWFASTEGEDEFNATENNAEDDPRRSIRSVSNDLPDVDGDWTGVSQQVKPKERRRGIFNTDPSILKARRRNNRRRGGGGGRRNRVDEDDNGRRSDDRKKRRRDRRRRGRRRRPNVPTSVLPPSTSDHWNWTEAAIETHRYNQSQRGVCQKRSLTVDFSDIGWEEWIISPVAFDAGYCAGTCSFPLSRRATNHATLQSIVEAVGLLPHVPAPCCVPDKLSSVSLLYFDTRRNVVLKNYPQMSVESCVCR